MSDKEEKEESLTSYSARHRCIFFLASYSVNWFPLIALHNISAALSNSSADVERFGTDDTEDTTVCATPEGNSARHWSRSIIASNRKSSQPGIVDFVVVEPPETCPWKRKAIVHQKFTDIPRYFVAVSKRTTKRRRHIKQFKQYATKWKVTRKNDCLD